MYVKYFRFISTFCIIVLLNSFALSNKSYTSFIEDLPIEIRSHILSYVSDENFINLSHTCKAMHQAAKISSQKRLFKLKNIEGLLAAGNEDTLLFNIKIHDISNFNYSDIKAVFLNRSIVSLEFSNVPVQQCIKFFMYHQTGYRALKNLSLNNSSINESSVESLFLFVSNYKLLRNFFFTKNNISFNACRLLSKALLTNEFLLETLNLENTNLDDKKIELIIQSLESNKLLKTLNLSYNKISDKSSLYMEYSLSRNKSLHTLYLENNEISDIGAEALGRSLKYNTNLVSLNLDKNIIGNQGIKTIVQNLEKNTSLKVLNLKYNKITIQGFKKIIPMMEKNKTLTVLDISGNDAEIDQSAFYQFPQLYYLSHYTL